MDRVYSRQCGLKGHEGLFLIASAALGCCIEEMPVYLQTIICLVAISYEAIFGKYLLDTLKENHNLTHYCHSALMRFDRASEWNRELLRTLKQYLLNGRRVSKTANDLHIHRNTMINRINIINGVLGIDIDELSEETVVHYLVSLLIQDEEV